MKRIIQILFIYSVMLSSTLGQQGLSTSESNWRLGVGIGYDFPANDFNFDHIDYNAGLSLGFCAEYALYRNISLGLDYDFIQNSPSSLLPSAIRYTTGLSATTVDFNKINRQFFGLGPTYRISLNNRISLGLGVRGGISLIEGGDILVSAIDPGKAIKDYHLVQTGFSDKTWSSKARVDLQYDLNPKLGINLNIYYMQQYAVHSDDMLDINNLGNVGLIYGTTDFDILDGVFSVSDRDALVIQDIHCGKITSVGAQVGLVYRFGHSESKKPKIEDDELPIVSGNKLLVTVLDGPSNTLIPDADVIIVDKKGNIIFTGMTNSFGIVEFTNIQSGDYKIKGKVYGINTSGTLIDENDFGSSTIRKQLLYEDLRFILKGVALNKTSRALEPNVVVNLTNKSSQQVNQDNTNGKGQFEFRLDPSSSYEVVGIKENRLSDIGGASTVGLTRSTTLFVELQLGLDNFNCGQGTVMDIKYEYDKADLLPQSRFELDRMVRYMNDHPNSRIEMAAHTDARGSSEYNLSLSNRRAQSAVNYIVSKGVSRSRIIAQGYGETRLLNGCKDGVKCTEDEHKLNRRTEAKLLCN